MGKNLNPFADKAKAEPPAPAINAVLKGLAAGQFEATLRQINPLRLQFPNSIQLLNMQAACYAGLKNFPSAIATYNKALALNDRHPPTLCNLGNALMEMGEVGKAQKSYEQAIRLKPDYAQAHNNLGVIHRDKRAFDKAINCFRTATELMPNYATAFYNLGTAFQDKQDRRAAIESFRQAIKITPNYVDALVKLGAVLHESGDVGGAKQAYQKALHINPVSQAARQNLCNLLEKTHELEELKTFTQALYKRDGKKGADWAFFEALAHFRLKDFAACFALITEIEIDSLAATNQLRCLELKAKCLHELGNYGDAFTAYADMNSKAKQSIRFNHKESERYFRQIQARRTQLESVRPAHRPKTADPANGPQLTFLVGFPRSGTTLLDNILRAHSRLEVLEERPLLDKVITYLGDETTLAQIESLQPGRLKKARQLYETELALHRQASKDGHVIDKLPLNIVQAPLIHKLYPNANYILALRHPLDCILSCYMQNFDLNPAMANMLDLGRITDLYCEGMRIFELCEARYALPVHKVRYEDLIGDFQTQVTDLLVFLGLEWESAIENYRTATALRHDIYTPSYSQVVQPLYDSAKMRWKKYRKQLEPHFEKIQPWVDKFGYNLEP